MRIKQSNQLDHVSAPYREIVWIKQAVFAEALCKQKLIQVFIKNRNIYRQIREVAQKCCFRP